MHQKERAKLSSVKHMDVTLHGLGAIQKPISNEPVGTQINQKAPFILAWSEQIRDITILQEILTQMQLRSTGCGETTFSSNLHN